MNVILILIYLEVGYNMNAYIAYCLNMISKYAITDSYKFLNIAISAMYCQN